MEPPVPPVTPTHPHGRPAVQPSVPRTSTPVHENRRGTVPAFSSVRFALNVSEDWLYVSVTAHTLPDAKSHPVTYFSPPGVARIPFVTRPRVLLCVLVHVSRRTPTAFAIPPKPSMPPNAPTAELLLD